MLLEIATIFFLTSRTKQIWEILDRYWIHKCIHIHGGLAWGKSVFFFYTIRFLTKMVSKSLLKLRIIIWKILVWDTFKTKINWVQPEYLTWVRFVTERNLIDITLSQVGKLPSGLQVYSSWLYNSLKITIVKKKKKTTKVYVPE